MHNNELVSIVTPAYNAEKYIRETLDCIVNQTYQNLEILIANDGSKDSTLSILKEYQAKDPRIIIDDHENMGISKSINRLTRMAKGDIVVRIDADDLMTLDRVEKQFRFFQENPKVDFVSCDAEFINEKGGVFGYQSFKGYNKIEDSREALQSSSPVICAQTGFATRKEAFMAVGGYSEDIIYAEDLDLFTRMVENGSSLIIIREPLVKYRLHANSAVASSKNLIRNQLYMELIHENLKRRRSKQIPLSFAEFKQIADKQSWFQHLNRRRKAMAFVSYRNAGALLGNKLYFQAAKQLLISFICKPMPFLAKSVFHITNFLKKK